MLTWRLVIFLPPIDINNIQATKQTNTFMLLVNFVLDTTKDIHHIQIS